MNASAHNANEPSRAKENTLHANERQHETISPAFPDKDAVTVVMAADDGYVPYLSTLFQSIVENASPERLYDVVILTTDISETHQRLMKGQARSSNVSLRFYDVAPLAKGKVENLKLRGHFQIETYYRLLMQDIFLGWDKVLYLDSDMVVLRDVAELFDTDVEGYLLAACRDADTAGLYNGYDPSRKPYTDEVLKLADPYSYFQAGTILFNLKMFREAFDVDDMFELASMEQWKLLDQDVLNILAQGCAKYVPMEWNVMTDWRRLRIKRIIGLAPKDMRDEYAAARNHPAIVHYAGPEKPWNDPSSDMAEYFWGYAERTPFLRELQERLQKNGAGRKLISDRAWDVLYPAFTRLFPDGSRRRKALAAMYRKLTTGKKG